MTDTKSRPEAGPILICNQIGNKRRAIFQRDGKYSPGLFRFLNFFVFLLFPMWLCAQDNLRNVQDPDPVLEKESFNVAEGFEVNLFADEPMLVKPIQMNWDEKGRLWVVGSKHYPQLKPGEDPNDKIYVLEDTTGDGKADVSTVFAEGLHIPTGILPGDGGAYVANATEILHLKDTNGDGKADQRRTILSGFGTGDTHHLVHTFRWGPAGRFYFNQSIYIHSRIETPHGIKELEGSGVWRFHPEKQELGVYSRGLINPWGLQFNKWGQSFLTDGAGREGINYAFPGATFVSAPGAERILQGLNPGQPKHSGLEIISGPHFPDSLQGSFITNDFRANRINRFVLEEQGSGYVSNQVEDLLWSDNVAFRPVDISIGPDGAIYVADWYNPIIQHGEVDFRDPRRDREHGRIWRISVKDRPQVEKPALNRAGITQLLDALKTPEKWTRSQAKRLLKERGADEVRPELQSWIDNLDAADPGYEHHLLEALWVFQSVDAVNEGLLKSVLNADKHQARAAAVRVLSYWQDRIDDSAALLQDAAEDDHPKVRLEAVIALRRQQSAEAASAALSALNSPMDKFLDFALWQTVRKLEPYWMSKIENDPSFFGSPRKKAFALKSVDNSQAVPHLLRMYKQGQVPEEYIEDVFDAVSKGGNLEDLNIVFELALDSSPDHKKRRAMYLSALEQAARQQDKKPDRDVDRIIQFTDDDSKPIAQRAIRLAGYWKLEKFREKAGALAREGDEDIQKAALDALVSMGGKKSLDLLVRLADANHPVELRLRATQRLVTLDAETAAAIAIPVLRDKPDQAEAEELFSTFLSQENGIQVLADALSDQKIPQEIAKTGRKIMQQQVPFNRSDDDDVQALGQALEASGGTLPPERMPQELSNQQLNRLEMDIKASADPGRGEKVFRELACGSCHAIGGAGGLMGPDLSSLGANAPTDYIIEGILKPSADIKDGYELNRVLNKNGSEVRGYIVNETSSEIVLRDIAGATVSVPKNQIESHETVPGSLMPPGLTSELERDEFVDLVGFLSKIGEPGEFRVPNDRLVRNWDVLQDNEKIAERINNNGVAYASIENTEVKWQPVYSEVSGELPVEELPVITLDDDRKFSFVAFEIEVLSGGNLDLVFNSANGITLWKDQVLLDPSGDRYTVELSGGVREFTLAVNHAARNDKPILVKVAESPDAPAKIRLVAGE